MRILKLFIIIILLASSLNESAAARPLRNTKVQEDTLALSCLGVAERFADVADDIVTRLEFYKSRGYTHYFYTPTDDRYCNAWGWKFLYNDGDRKMLRELNEVCRKTGLEFVWTVNHGDSYGWTQKDYEFLKNKLVMMYYNGIKSFAVRLSPDSGDFMALEDSLNADMLTVLPKAKVNVRVLNNIPDVAYPSEDDRVKSLMKGYHFDESFLSRASAADAILCVLTEKGELAKTALVAVAECAIDPSAYVADVAMEKGIMTLSPEVKSPLMTFLEHTGGVKESESVITFNLDEWSPDKSSALLAEFEKIEKVPSGMAKCSSSVLLDGLAPWLEEFGKLGTRGIKTIRALQYYKEGNLGDFWLAYIDTLLSEEERQSYSSHPVGEKKLHPFCVNIMSELTEAFSSMMTGSSNFKNLASDLSPSPCPASDSDLSTSVHSDDCIGFQIPQTANACRLLTGPLRDDRLYLFRQLAKDGSLVAEFVITSPYSEYDLKEGAVAVDVLGDVDIYETIFVYL